MSTVIEPGSPLVYVARLITGICMAGIYPVGMKMAGSWAKGDLGLLVAILVGALTLGSAAPHLFNAFGGIDWRFTIMTTSAAGLFAALAINLVKIGPRQSATRAFSASQLALAFRDPALRLANFGYLGHMWELYAMWAWLGIFLASSFEINSGGYDPDLLARYATFAVIGAGGLIGCLAGGLLSDRYGRTTLTMAAMAISGSCALVVGFLFGGPPLLLGIICLIWGITIIADSAQFSASITELSEPELIGTMLTVQTCAGFILTLITIHLMPLLVDTVGWSWAFAPLSIGPFLGVWAMARLRRHPDSVRMAAGQR